CIIVDTLLRVEGDCGLQCPFAVTPDGVARRLAESLDNCQLRICQLDTLPPGRLTLPAQIACNQLLPGVRVFLPWRLSGMRICGNFVGGPNLAHTLCHWCKSHGKCVLCFVMQIRS